MYSKSHHRTVDSPDLEIINIEPPGGMNHRTLPVESPELQIMSMDPTVMPPGGVFAQSKSKSPDLQILNIEQPVVLTEEVFPQSRSESPDIQILGMEHPVIQPVGVFPQSRTKSPDLQILDMEQPVVPPGVQQGVVLTHVYDDEGKVIALKKTDSTNVSNLEAFAIRDEESCIETSMPLNMEEIDTVAVPSVGSYITQTPTAVSSNMYRNINPQSVVYRAVSTETVSQIESSSDPQTSYMIRVDGSQHTRPHSMHIINVEVIWDTFGILSD